MRARTEEQLERKNQLLFYYSKEDITEMFIDAETLIDALKYKIKMLEEENKELKEQVIIMEKYLELITDLALDHYGCKTTKSLKGLIDELKRLACLGRACNVTETIYVNNNKAYNILLQELERGEENVKN